MTQFRDDTSGFVTWPLKHGRRFISPRMRFKTAKKWMAMFADATFIPEDTR